jgi:hypothetical protein
MYKGTQREVEFKVWLAGHGQSFFQQHPLQLAGLTARFSSHTPEYDFNGFQIACQKSVKQHWATKRGQDMPTC